MIKAAFAEIVHPRNIVLYGVFLAFLVASMLVWTGILYLFFNRYGFRRSVDEDEESMERQMKRLNKGMPPMGGKKKDDVNDDDDDDDVSDDDKDGNDGGSESENYEDCEDYENYEDYEDYEDYENYEDYEDSGNKQAPKMELKKPDIVKSNKADLMISNRMNKFQSSGNSGERSKPFLPDPPNRNSSKPQARNLQKPPARNPMDETKLPKRADQSPNPRETSVLQKQRGTIPDSMNGSTKNGGSGGGRRIRRSNN